MQFSFKFLHLVFVFHKLIYFPYSPLSQKKALWERGVSHYLIYVTMLLIISKFQNMWLKHCNENDCVARSNPFSPRSVRAECEV